MDDNRKSIRIDSRVRLGHRIVSAEEFAAIRQDCDNGISLYNRPGLDNIQAYLGAHGALARLQEKNKDLALFLQHLDSKLNLLLEKMEATPTVLQKLELQRVNLGGNGLAFWSSETHQAGDIVEVQIIMPDDSTYINCFCEVVDCVPDAGTEAKCEFRVALRYALIMESDQEMLIQHNFKQQSLSLARRRLEQN
ncbi:MAG: PilZ domain-containing protein [Desulfobulbaceae bacterium]|nr:PilZ domain-containing protein [Desulfobulbaceae bacterium]